MAVKIKLLSEKPVRLKPEDNVCEHRDLGTDANFYAHEIDGVHKLLCIVCSTKVRKPLGTIWPIRKNQRRYIDMKNKF